MSSGPTRDLSSFLIPTHDQYTEAEENSYSARDYIFRHSVKGQCANGTKSMITWTRMMEMSIIKYTGRIGGNYLVVRRDFFSPARSKASSISLSRSAP